MTYDYPPSKHVLRYGLIEEGSHFYCKGVAFFENSRLRKMKCMFEVAYSQECEVIVVCYFNLPSISMTARWFENCTKIVGRDVLSGRNIAAKINYNKRWTQSPIGASELTMTYQASCYKVFWPSYRLSNEDSKPYPPHFEIASFEFPSWLDPNDKNFDEESNATIPFLIDDNMNIIFKLLFKHRIEQLEYSSQATGRLAVPDNNLPKEWSAPRMADVWCALMSIATGKDIQWSSWFIPLTRTDYQERTWFTRNIKPNTEFHAYIFRGYGFLTKNDVEVFQSFIQRCFKIIMAGLLSEVEGHNYVRIIREYVDYCTIRTSAEGKARLISTLTENLMLVWEENEGLKPAQLMSRGERNKLEELVGQTLKEKSHEFLDDENISNFDLISEKLSNFIHLEIRDVTLVNRMRFFFSENGIDFSSNIIDKRVIAFKDTRNSIAHSGWFSHLSPNDNDKLIYFCGNKDHGWQHEYENMLMLIPLMIFTIFRYSGEYQDMIHPKYNQTWRFKSD